jgi:hypothetical protein
VRVALHLPLAVAFLAVGLAALVTAGALGHWWKPRIRPRDAALAVPFCLARVLAPHRLGVLTAAGPPARTIACAPRASFGPGCTQSGRSGPSTSRRGPPASCVAALDTAGW